VPVKNYPEDFLSEYPIRIDIAVLMLDICPTGGRNEEKKDREKKYSEDDQDRDSPGYSSAKGDYARNSIQQEKEKARRSRRALFCEVYARE
jgi:hypothetical protein